MADKTSDGVSRRNLLKGTAAAVAGGGASLMGVGSAFGQAPAVQTGGGEKKMTGTKFRAYIRHKGGQTSGVETLTLRDIQAREVVVRSQAAQACYTIVAALVPALPPIPPVPGALPVPVNPALNQAAIIGHGAVGIVEQIGSEVKRVKVGDRVIVPVTPQCGQCYNCLRNRADACTAGVGRPVVPVADQQDGTPVFGTLGGFAELMVAWEEQTVPITSNVPAAELSLLCCVMSVGLGLATRRMPVEPGSNVVVLGAGPLGLSAVQGARIQGAAQIIVVEPIKYRRDLAMKLGATATIDPNEVKGQDLINKIRIMTAHTEPSFAGGRGPNPNAQGPDFVLEAVGGDRFTPKTEVGPDPTGVESLQLAWTLCPAGGIVRTCGVGQPRAANVTFPAGQWANATKTHLPGNFAGVNTLRDIPSFIRLIETKQFDAKSLVGTTFKLEQAKEALQAAADRTTISSIITFA